MKHAVGLIEDEHFKRAEIELLAADEIDQTSRRGDDHVHALVHGFNLRFLLHAAEDGGHADGQAAAVRPDVFHDLHRELAGGGEDESLGDARLALPIAQGNAVEHRQHEGRGLAGAGLGDGDQVVPLHHLGNGRRLNRSRAGVTCFLNGAEDFFSKSEVAERHAPTLRRPRRP